MAKHTKTNLKKLKLALFLRKVNEARELGMLDSPKVQAELLTNYFPNVLKGITKMEYVNNSLELPEYRIEESFYGHVNSAMEIIR